jgi:hypothetical protein
MAPQPTDSSCPERDRLGEAYLDAVRTLNELLHAQAESLIAGRGNLERFDLAITVARDRRNQAKLAYAAHVQAHGCSR